MAIFGMAVVYKLLLGMDQYEPCIMRRTTKPTALGASNTWMATCGSLAAGMLLGCLVSRICIQLHGGMNPWLMFGGYIPT